MLPHVDALYLVPLSVLTPLPTSSQNPSQHEEGQEEYEARVAAKPKPKYDPISGKWVVMNWDGSVAGVKNGDQRKFDQLTAENGTEGQPTRTGESTTRQMSGLTEDSSVDDSGSIRETAAEVGMQVSGEGLKPFARVDAVAERSPADSAGLKEEDLILKFGSIDHTNHNHLRAIGALVPEVAAMKREIQLVVHRRNETKFIVLAPQPWQGRGLIGCHIVPHHE